MFALIGFPLPLCAPDSLCLSFCLLLCACMCLCSSVYCKCLHVSMNMYILVYKHLCICLCVPPLHLLLEPFTHSVSIDLSSVLTQQALVPSTLFSKLSQGVKQAHVTAEDGSMLSGLAQDRVNVEM